MIKIGTSQHPLPTLTRKQLHYWNSPSAAVFPPYSINKLYTRSSAPLLQHKNVHFSGNGVMYPTPRMMLQNRGL